MTRVDFCQWLEKPVTHDYDRAMRNTAQNIDSPIKSGLKPHALDMTLAELTLFMSQIGEPAYRARQLFGWLHARRVFDPEAMTDFPKPLRTLLQDELRVSLNKPEETLVSRDGSRKFLYRLDDGAYVESVLIPSQSHTTLCISSQVGCAMGCAFCLTGRQGLTRNLSAGEIVNQYLSARSTLPEDGLIRNIVMMGMGEPLANYEQTVKALGILTTEGGAQVGRRHITVSTVGIAPMIAKLGKDLDVNLAVSLNAPNDEVRSQLMPVNRTYPLSELLAACKAFPLTKGRRITFEYILIRDVNDSPSHARQLAKLLRPVKAKINLIPFNEHPGAPFQEPTPETVETFQKELVLGHYTAIIRKSMGRDILAACGQLAHQAKTA